MKYVYMNVDKPSIQDEEKALKGPRNRKCPGEDQIKSELLKYGGKVLSRNLPKFI